MEFLVTYDVATADRAGERRLARLAKVCEGYGLRVQKSVFECRLTAAAFERMVGDAVDVIRPDVDSLNIYRFPGSLEDARMMLGRQLGSEPGGPWIV
jgi:CRISPR-associated protein Cas2